jgi:uncharacterized membrane protein
MSLYRVQTQIQNVGNVFVALTLGEKLQDLSLPRGQKLVAVFRSFERSEPRALRSFTAIVSGAARLDGRSLIMLGLLLLIATPVARVCFSLVVFIAQRDRVYVAITLVVLSVLLFALFGQHA